MGTKVVKCDEKSALWALQNFSDDVIMNHDLGKVNKMTDITASSLIVLDGKKILWKQTASCWNEVRWILAALKDIHFTFGGFRAKFPRSGAIY